MFYLADCSAGHFGSLGSVMALTSRQQWQLKPLLLGYPFCATQVVHLSRHAREPAPRLDDSSANDDAAGTNKPR